MLKYKRNSGAFILYLPALRIPKKFPGEDDRIQGETPDSVVNLMLTTCENWNAVCLFAKEVLVHQMIINREQEQQNLYSPEATLDSGLKRGRGRSDPR